MSYASRWAKTSEKPTSEATTSKPAVFLNRAADGLVNTSLPAQRAPKLAPTTLAAATLSSTTLKPMEASEKYRTGVKPMDDKRRVTPANVESADEFPSLGKAVPKAPKAADPPKSMNFAALSRDWAQKQKEDEEKAKEEKEKQRLADYINRGSLVFGFPRKKQTATTRSTRMPTRARIRTSPTCQMISMPMMRMMRKKKRKTATADGTNESTATRCTETLLGKVCKKPIENEKKAAERYVFL